MLTTLKKACNVFKRGLEEGFDNKTYLPLKLNFSYFLLTCLEQNPLKTW